MATMKRVRTCLNLRTIRRAVCLAALAMAFAFPTGCETEPVVVRSGWDTLDPNVANPFGRRKDAATEAELPDGVDSEVQWAIATDQYAGVSHRRVAEQRAAQLRRATDMPQFWVQDEGSRSTVYYGRFDSAQDPKGREAMAKLRRVNGRGDVRFGTLAMTPLIEAGGAIDSALAKYDLRRASRRGVYTLQIGYYESEDNSRKKSAEKAVTLLREDDVRAYFYHGPNRSMVTVGVFGDDAIVTNQGEGRQIRTSYSVAVRELQARFPHNLANGAPIEETRQGSTTQQPSFLVRIPR